MILMFLFRKELTILINISLLTSLDQKIIKMTKKIINHLQFKLESSLFSKLKRFELLW